jgi:hypothetical protein
LLPLLDALLVHVLTTRAAVGDVSCGRFEIFLAYATAFDLAVVVESFAILLELRLEQAGGAADEVFVHGEFAVNARDLEAYDSFSDTVLI